MAPIWSKQPFKTIYIASLFIKIPLLLVLCTRYVFTVFRPLSHLTFRICLFTRLVREYVLFQAQTRCNEKSIVEASQVKAKDRFVKVKPADDSLYVDVLTASKNIKPAEVGGVWYPSPPPPGADLKDEKAVLHFPGGAFVIACGTDTNGKVFSSFAQQNLKADRVFFAQYRVAEDHSTRFPAAIQDLVTFYNYILSLGYDLSNILVSGDSAAGNLTTALIRYLERTSVLPLPAGAMLWSPWTHVTTTAGKDYEKQTNVDADFLVPEILQWGADAYLPETGMTKEVLPYISPLHHPFRTTVPVFIHVGNAEGLYDTIQSFTLEMSKVEGNKVKLHVTNRAPHNPVFSHMVTGLTEEIRQAFEDARAFLDY